MAFTVHASDTDTGQFPQTGLRTVEAIATCPQYRSVRTLPVDEYRVEARLPIDGPEDRAPSRWSLPAPPRPCRSGARAPSPNTQDRGVLRAALGLNGMAPRPGESCARRHLAMPWGSWFQENAGRIVVCPSALRHVHCHRGGRSGPPGPPSDSPLPSPLRGNPGRSGHPRNVRKNHALDFHRLPHSAHRLPHSAHRLPHSAPSLHHQLAAGRRLGTRCFPQLVRPRCRNAAA